MTYVPNIIHICPNIFFFFVIFISIYFAMIYAMLSLEKCMHIYIYIYIFSLPYECKHVEI